MLDDTLAPAILIKTKGKFLMPTIDLHTHFLSPVALGDITCEANIVKLGRKIAFTEGSLFDAAGKLCARASASSMLIPVPENVDILNMGSSD